MINFGNVDLRVSLFILIVLSANSAFGSNAAAPERAAARVAPSVREIGSDIKVIQFANGVNVEQIRSQSARTHLQNVKLRHPEAFTAARAAMLARGFLPANEVFVERTYHQTPNKKQSDRKRPGSNDKPYSLVQTSSEDNSDGEIIFESYEGPDGTWQGTIYVEFYSNGVASTWNAQIDTSSQDYPYTWLEKTWSYAGDGGPLQIRSLTKPPLPGSMIRAAAIQYASWKPGSTQVLPVGMNWYGWATCWRAGVIGGCGTAAVGCIRVTAAWPACFATWCIGAEISSAVVCGINYYN